MHDNCKSTNKNGINTQFPIWEFGNDTIQKQRKTLPHVFGNAFLCFFSTISHSRLALAQLGNDGEIDDVLSGEVLHVVAMTSRTIVNLPSLDGLNLVVVVESERTAEHQDYLTVVFMQMRASRCARTKDAVHDLAVAVGIVLRHQLAYPTLETHDG